MKQDGTNSLSGLYLFVAAYVSLFAIAGVLLFGPGIFPRTVLVPDGAGQGGHAALLSTEIDCESLKNITELQFLAGGWTKAVYKGRFLGTPVAVKTVNLDGHSLKECQDKGHNISHCYNRAAAKIVKEMLLLRELVHDNIVKVLGSCIPQTSGPVAMVTELGEPLDTVRLLQLAWEDRLRLVLGMAKILHLLAHSPLGSLAMNDFRRQQFVIVDGILKLSDVDDIGLEEPSCETRTDCIQVLPLQLRNTSETWCSPETKRCVGHNERLNIWRAGKHFIHQFLPLGAPAGLRPLILGLLKGYREASWSSAKILSETESLVHIFSSGQYLESNEVVNMDINSLPGFTILEGKDLPGQFDYPCPESRSAVNCIRSVHSLQEAADLCSADYKCKAFVIGHARTWTGRVLAIFKSGVGPPTPTRGHKLIFRRDGLH
ncbi:extracellular tyrosine-protein kinase PKDCC-like [Neocloeon triangulifer]|uniref:extracellular tyrosine-protein kinase PKDCC-like n=1 Tax=Neocloeon triangulifer TaxID=2078957 RepID=UPI00286FA34B|nr:extracellular tyrosine-protein kinase PKDCC-like [Neocloeon triangulifer]